MARHAILLVALVLAACDGDETKQLEKARSWRATAVLVAEDWTRGEVPSAYARDALKKAADQLAPGPSPQAARQAADLGVAVARDDRAAARRLIGELRR
ncbi:MAG TPA: hypothetical protein VE935_04250 [Burkholderiales bacterium]|jgi:hypothetical protein|nr:hypothetical protein [Burkholderiales bacterium]